MAVPLIALETQMKTGSCEKGSCESGREGLSSSYVSTARKMLLPKFYKNLLTAADCDCNIIFTLPQPAFRTSSFGITSPVAPHSIWR